MWENEKVDEVGEGGGFYSRLSLTDQAEMAPQNETSSYEKRMDEDVEEGSFYSRLSFTDQPPLNESFSNKEDKWSIRY